MDITFLTIILVALLVLAPLVLLVISGQLIRSRMHLPAPTRRGNRDLQSLEDALVEFFARSKASSCILTVLAARGKPVGFNALVDAYLSLAHRDILLRGLAGLTRPSSATILRER